MYPRYSASSCGSHKNYQTSRLPARARLFRIGFYLFSMCSFLICLLMILYHSRVFKWSLFVRNAVVGSDEANDDANEHKFSSVLYSLGFGIDFLFLLFYSIQQKVNRPMNSPHKYYIMYLGITLLFIVYFLSILLMFSARTLGMIEKPISEDFLLNFALFETHVLCMTMSSAMKAFEFQIIDKCTRKNDLFFMDQHWWQTPVLENGGAQPQTLNEPRYSLAEQRGSLLVMYS
ncbi:hypothetical protein M3Y97_00647800 [Aphelenchoides bicaudatus]|nr:hypothetical protein M3Y97_00647800 [Aphelenchoides bicaudatus]